MTDMGEQLYELALFAGAGGGILGSILCGHAIVGAVEIEAHPRQVLLARQRDGILPEFPIWDDVTTFRCDNPECRPFIDKLRTVADRLVISGGFPCQDLSIANPTARGLDGDRSGLWFEMSRVVGEIRPRYVLVENSPMLVVRGGIRVVADLAALGYDCRWGTVGGHSSGFCADGKRLWLLAHASHCERRAATEVQAYIIDPQESRRRQFERAVGACASEEADAKMLRDSDGLADRVDRCASAGNGQFPRLVEVAWEILR